MKAVGSGRLNTSIGLIRDTRQAGRKADCK